MNERRKRDLKKRRKVHAKSHDIGRDTAEHRRTKEEPAKSEQVYRDLADHAATGMATVDLKGCFTYVNQVMADFMGHPAQDLMGRPFKDYIHPEDRSRITRLFLKAVLLRRPPTEIELRAMRLDGSVRRLLMRPWPMRTGGKTIGFGAVTVDVTERKQMEDSLQESQKRLSTLLNSVQVGIVVIDAETRKIVDANRAAVEMIGLPREQVLGQVCHKFVCPAEQDKCPIIDLGQRVDNSERVLLIASGHRIPILKTVNSQTLNGRRQLIESFLDITERKQMEDRLRASEERHRSLLERMHDALLVFGEDRRIEFANRQVEAFVGYKPEEIIGEKFDKLLTPEGVKGIAERYEKRRKGEPVPQTYELQAVAKDGTVKDFEISAALYTIDGKPKTIAAFKDITERKRMQHELEESEARYRGLFENSQDAITINTPDGKYLDFNQAYLNLLGYSKDEIPELNASDTYADPADRDRFRQEVERNGFVKDFDVKFRRKDGSVRDCLLTSTAWKDKKGHIIGYQGIVRDITERKRMEEELRRSEGRFRTIFQSSPIPALITSIEGPIIDANDAWVRMSGYSREEAIGHSTIELGVTPDPRQRDRIWKDLLEKKRLSNVEMTRRTKSGELRDLLNTIELVELDGKKCILNMQVDITERKRAEERLKLSEEKLKALHIHAKELATAETIEEVTKQTLDVMEFTLGFDVADFCTVEKDHILVLGSRGIQAAPKLWEWPLEGPGVVVKSIETKKTLRVADTGKEPSFVDRRTFSETEKPQLSELAVPVLIDNTIVGVLNVESSELNAFTDADQELLETLATHVASALGRLRQVDTLEKLVEGRTRELKQSEEKYRRIYNTSLSAIYTTTLAGDILDMNPAGVSMLGYDSPDELRKVNITNVYITPEERARFLGLANRGHVRGFETQLRRKDGKIIDVLANAHVLRYEKDQIAGFQLSLTDITEHKRMERMRDEFVADVTDELLTPLVSIKGYIDYVLKEKQTSLPEDTASSLQAVKRNTDRLLDLTNALVDIRRMESGRLELSSQPLDLREIVEQCVAEAQPLIAEKQSLHVQLPEGPLPIQGDPARVSQILMNLLSNAAKYAPEGKIILRVKAMEDAIEVQVSDTGIGIRKEDLPRVFEPFAAIQKPTYVKGTGLGLSITKGLVEAHGGNIGAESEGEGKGAFFTFTLPRRRGGN